MQATTGAIRRRASVFGASGYTGLELVRLLRHHSMVELHGLSSDRWANERIADHAASPDDALWFVSHEALLGRVGADDVAFLATPAASSLDLAPKLLAAGATVIDCSGAFRLADPELYPTWYGFSHTAREWLAQAHYGLADIFPSKFGQRLIANPGCYATAAALCLVPLVRADVLDLAQPIFVDGKSGTTGAGRKEEHAFSFSEVADTVRPYRMTGHPHTPEIEQTLERARGTRVSVRFVPHLVPMRRGLLVTAHAVAQPQCKQENLDTILQAFFQDAPWIRVRTAGRPLPETSRTLYTNAAEVGAYYDARTGTIAACCALDNLDKGAAGQAIQNMNAALGFLPTLGLLP